MGKPKSYKWGYGESFLIKNCPSPHTIKWFDLTWLKWNQILILSRDNFWPKGIQTQNGGKGPYAAQLAETSSIIVLPLARKSHTPPTHTWPNIVNNFPKKEGLLFSLIDHPAHPIGRGGSNQRELLASPSPDSSSPCASLGTSFFQ